MIERWKNWKSKKTLRIEAALFEDLYEEAEGDLARLRDEREMYARPKTYVLAKTHRRAVEALENMHLNPHARNVRIITEPVRARGVRLEVGAHVMYSQGWDYGQHGEELRREWDHVLAASKQWKAQRWVCETI